MELDVQFATRAYVRYSIYFWTPTFLAIVLGTQITYVREFHPTCHSRFPRLSLLYQVIVLVDLSSSTLGMKAPQFSMGHGWPEGLPSMGGENQQTQHGELTGNSEQCEHKQSNRGIKRVLTRPINMCCQQSNTRMWPTHPCRELWVCSQQTDWPLHSLE